MIVATKDVFELDEIPPASPREKKKVHFNLVPMIKTTTEDHPTTTTRVVKKIVRKVQVRRVRRTFDLDTFLSRSQYKYMSGLYYKSDYQR